MRLTGTARIAATGISTSERSQPVRGVAPRTSAAGEANHSRLSSTKRLASGAGKSSAGDASRSSGTAELGDQGAQAGVGGLGGVVVTHDAEVVENAVPGTVGV